jgi:UDP-N-acetyl-D-galactosamine dehydrogenase
MLVLSSDKKDIKDCNVYVVAVPTPVNEKMQPDLTPLIKVSEMLGTIIDEGDIVIYESTTYPGCTEEVCIPCIEKTSGMKFNKDFFVGYSPERINPGDKEHTVEKIKKVTSGCNEEIAQIVDDLYNSVLVNGTFKATSIKVAEASKIIENTQRDCNIAFFNELSRICDVLGISTNDVIEAASTKWNFNVLHPGLVGGHCIGVDPYYLIEKSRSCGYNPEFISRARDLNESMGKYVADKFIKKLIMSDKRIKDGKFLILGFTFKENCPDIRNTKVINIYNELKQYTDNIVVCDPLADKESVKKEYGIDIVNEIPSEEFDGILLAVKHKEFDNIENITISLKEI